MSGSNKAAATSAAASNGHREDKLNAAAVASNGHTAASNGHTATSNGHSTASNGHREDILNAAIEVFGRVGYAAASTNEIVKRANVSKGLLFHHFTNKEKLYTACQLHVIDKYSQFMTDYIDLSSADFFDRVLSNLRIKMEFGRRNPEFLALINRAWFAEGEEGVLTRKAAEEYVVKNVPGSMFGVFFEGIDKGLFKEGIELEKVFSFSRMALEASWAQYSKKHQNNVGAMTAGMDDYIKECEEIILLFRYGAYK